MAFYLLLTARCYSTEYRLDVNKYDATKMKQTASVRAVIIPTMSSVLRFQDMYKQQIIHLHSQNSLQKAIKGKEKIPEILIRERRPTRNNFILSPKQEKKL